MKKLGRKRQRYLGGVRKHSTLLTVLDRESLRIARAILDLEKQKKLLEDALKKLDKEDAKDGNV